MSGAVGSGSPGEVLLKVDRLSKSFGGIQAVKDVSFTLKEGEIVGLIGPNGAGKTTLVNLITGVFPASGGSVVFRGEDIFPIVREKLRERFPGIKFVTYDVFGNVHGPKQTELVADVPRLLKAHGCNAVISAIGA